MVHKRWAWVAALGLLANLLSGCAQPVEAEPEERPVPQEQKPAPSPFPSPSSMRVAPSLALTVAKQARAYTGRGPWFLLVAELAPGDRVEYLDSREGWFWVQLPDGRRAWLAASEAEVADGRNLGGQYQVQTGRWGLTAPGGLTVEVTRRAPGVMRVLVECQTITDLGPVGERSVAVLTPDAEGFEGALAVGDSGLAGVSVSPHGVLVELEKPASHTVVSRSAGRVELEFRPVLAGVAALPIGWRFEVQGETRPVLRQAEGALLVEIPAAVSQAALPEGLQVENVSAEDVANAQPISSLSATIPIRMPAGGLRLRLPMPEGPYALSQPQPGRYELRWLSPGLKGKKVVLDPGHGGEETGAVGPNGVAEKRVNLAVALRLKPLLEAAGAEVIMTRTEDARVLTPAEAERLTSYQERTQADLAARSALANRLEADLVLSIHANGGPPGDGGIEVFWAVPNLNAAQSLRLAGLAQTELVGALGLADRGVKQRPFNVIRYSEAPAVLVELGFMTNPAEEELLLSDWGQQRSAEALLRAVRQYFDEGGDE